MTKTIVIAGSVAQKPARGGHTWVFLQYLLGLRRLGFDVLFLDQLQPGMGVDEAGQPCPLDRSVNCQYLAEVMEGFGLQGRWAIVEQGTGQSLGLNRREVVAQTRKAALLINVMGFLSDAEILKAAGQRVFLDIDPGFPQMWADLGLHDALGGYDHYVTIGQNIGQPGCTIPLCGRAWITTPQPIVLEAWRPAGGPHNGSFTSVATWRGAYGLLEYRGKTYGPRAHEFRQFLQLPRLSGRSFQLALDIHPAEEKDLALLAENGWSLVDPTVVARDPWAYQGYIQGSKAEFMVAKNMYVQANSGWFSDRSICYLASGKPVLVLDTGLHGLYPSGEGLLTFRTLDEALAKVEELCRHYDQHVLAARALAEEYFDSDKVLPRLLGQLGIA